MIGKVGVDGPLVKKAITNSSKERVNANSAPAKIAGASDGSVILKKVMARVAPKSKEASRSAGSLLFRRALTTAETKAMLKTT